MVNIRLLSTCMAQPTANKKKPDQRIHLTQADLKLLLVGYIQKGLLFPKPKQSEDQTLLIQHLKSSLSRTLDFFTPLAGRLATVEQDDDTISYFIDCNNEGAQFVHAAADDVTMSDILEPVYVPPIVHSFFPLDGVFNYEGVSNPLLAVQVTELVDGIFIGCTMNHSIADGTAFWDFFKFWSEICRGLDHFSKHPALERWSLLNGSTCPPPVRLLISSIKNNSATVFPPPVQERVFHFSNEKIAELKTRANAEVPSNSISSLQSLLAHIWRATTRSRQVDLDEEVDLIICVGTRTRLQPPLPEKYFGNAFLPGTVTMKAREILEHGLGFVSLQINKLVYSYTEDKVKGILESFLENPNPITIGNFARNNSLIVSSSPRFNVFDTDFGFGKPEAVRWGRNKYDGKMTLFPGKEEGSIDVGLCVLPETLKAMENDLEFIDAVFHV